MNWFNGFKRCLCQPDPSLGVIIGHACGWLQGMVYFLGFSQIFHGIQNETIFWVGIFYLPCLVFSKPKQWKIPGRNSGYQIAMDFLPGFYSHWIGLRENLQESPIFNGKNHGFL